MTMLHPLRQWWHEVLSFEALDCGWPLEVSASGRRLGLFDGQWELSGPSLFADEEPASPM